MDFDKSKKEVLDKLYLPDKSKKGNVDEKLIPLIDLINKQDNFYTTSSCSGRISIFTDNDSKIKNGSEWLFVTHNETSFEQIKDSLTKISNSLTLFKVEGLILHVACRTYEDAVKFMVLCQNNGFKHTGIIGVNKRFIVQVLGVDRFEAPIGIKKELLVDIDYLYFLIEQANIKLQKTHNKIDRLFSAFQKEFDN
jgi:tRNA wybutosine-synthesizing protein 3